MIANMMTCFQFPIAAINMATNAKANMMPVNPQQKTWAACLANTTCHVPNAHCHNANIWEALGGLSSSTTTQLTLVLTTLSMNQVNVDYLLPGTHDAAANSKALVVPDDSNVDKSAKSAMTISLLRMTAVMLYVELIGRRET